MSTFQRGYGDAKNANGNCSILQAGLESLYQQFEDACRQDTELQKQLHKVDEDQLQREQASLKGIQTKIELTQDEIVEHQESCDKLNENIALVKSNPEAFGLDVSKKPRAQFYIGTTLLLIITLYLFVFYISASYSSFFKDFDTEDADTVAALFDANALTKAINDGWLEALFVGTIPFAFMGLGYLIHMFQKSDRNLKILKISALFLVTFIFDVILAYQIEKKIYEVDKTLDSPLFDLPIAITKPQFWAIIFAGFVVYIIWGLIFDFVMKEYDELDKIKVELQKFRKQLRLKKITVEEKQKEVRELRQKASEIQAEIDRILVKLNNFVFPIKRYLLEATAYYKGWLMAISKEIALPSKEKQELIGQCEKIEYDHRRIHGLLGQELPEIPENNEI